MRQLQCPQCGSRDLVDAGNYTECLYCRTSFIPAAGDRPPPSSSIALDADIAALLQKCIDDPANRRRYASLILDLDPTNQQVRHYL